MNQPPKNSAGRALLWIGRGVAIELIRRKDLYVLFLLMAVFVVGALAVNLVGIDNPSTATFLLNLGLTLAYVFAHVLTLLLAARQLPTEIENRTIYPLLARPISRETLLLGKWGACTACGVLVFVPLFLMGWIAVPKLEAYDPALLVQALALQVVSLGLTAALALGLSLVVQKGVAIALTGGLLFFGHSLFGFIQSVIAENRFSTIFRWLTLYVPDFSKLSLLTRYTDGVGAVSITTFAGLLVYGTLFSIVTLAFSSLAFRRRAL